MLLTGIRSLSHQTLFPLFKMVIFPPLMVIFPPFNGSFSHLLMGHFPTLTSNLSLLAYTTFPPWYTVIFPPWRDKISTITNLWLLTYSPYWALWLQQVRVSRHRGLDRLQEIVSCDKVSNLQVISNPRWICHLPTMEACPSLTWLMLAYPYTVIAITYSVPALWSI